MCISASKAICWYHHPQVVLEEWSKDLISSWNKHGWFTAPQRVGDKLARIVGAPPGAVVVADSTSVNLFKAASAALQLRPDRTVILSGAVRYLSLALAIIACCTPLLHTPM